jgi:hypothetical protein
LDRPSRVSLGLTEPFFLHSLAEFCEFHRQRERIQWLDIGIPSEPSWSWNDSAAQPAIIRRLAKGCYEFVGTLRPIVGRDDLIEERDREDAMVDGFLSEWLKAKFNIEEGCVLCRWCWRFMCMLRPDGEPSPWVSRCLESDPSR